MEILKKELKKYSELAKAGALDLFLETVLNIMKMAFLLQKDFREENIKDFNGRYSFKSKDGTIAVSVIFENSKMTVKRYAIDNTDITVIFKDSNALKNFLFSENPDIIGSILNNDISPVGNLNYLFKFAYMAKHLQLMFSL